MKLTKSQLKQIIKEEIQRSLKEEDQSTSPGTPPKKFRRIFDPVFKCLRKDKDETIAYLANYEHLTTSQKMKSWIELLPPDCKKLAAQRMRRAYEAYENR